MAQIVLAQTDSPTAPSAGQTAFSFPATALNQFKWVDADGGTNIIDGGGFTLTIDPLPQARRRCWVRRMCLRRRRRVGVGGLHIQ
jgi:hypothetical protein